ncbi:MAG TPA: CoA pyrophosphatase [Thermoplasmata archaeon]|nr:CoA pyrophosphatase [Thermoplasmata archaeon]
MPRESPDALRRVLLPLDLAEAELRTKPAAAVMLVLHAGPKGLEVLLTVRQKREGDPWSGQVGLPGGMHHPEVDGTILGTALRETREEVGLDLDGRAEILGHMPPRAPGNKLELLVVPYVALSPERLEPSTGPEMEVTFWAVLGDLPPTRDFVVVPTILGDLRVPAFRYEGRVIWGFTYRVLEELLVLVGLSA